MRLRIASPSAADEVAFLAAVARSREVFGDWVSPPADRAAFASYLASRADERQAAYVGWLGDEPVGVVNVNEIVRGVFRSAYLGYYAFAPHAGRGLMRELLARALDDIFGDGLELHRVEANIQPDNERSVGLVRRLGFRHEGFSPRYLHIAGAWRDHERWALLADEWPGAAAHLETRQI